MIFASQPLSENQAKVLSPRLLAHLGDAVFDLFLRERELLSAASVQALHRKTASQACAGSQADFLDHISGSLTDKEADIVRRARNARSSGRRSAGQDAYRKSTAFEALLGYLYLTDMARLEQILQLTAAGKVD